MRNLKQIIVFLALSSITYGLSAEEYASNLDATASTLESPVSKLARPTESDSLVYGKTIGNWGHAWWLWAFNIPKATNPLFKNGVMDCSVAQTGNVWFLAGNFGEVSERSCTIPSGKALFFPLYNSVWWTPAPGTDAGCKNEINCRQAVNQSVLGVKSYSCRIDGQPCIWRYPIVRSQSDNLPFTINPDSILVTEYEDLAGTRNTSISDGYWVMIPPLKTGAHTIRFTAKATDFALDVTYKLTIQ
jgi:hypothetical protein